MIQETLNSLHACVEAKEWAKQFDDWQILWDKCERGDWMLWLCGKYTLDGESEARKKLVAAACDCAELALKYAKEGEERPRVAIETARKWIKGEATIAEVRSAAESAYAADAADAAADAAVSASAYAAHATYAAADAAASAYAAYAAYAAADAAAYVAHAADAAREKTLKKCAEIVRKYYPKPPVNE
jgi:hypothetical protein